MATETKAMAKGSASVRAAVKAAMPKDDTDREPTKAELRIMDTIKKVGTETYQKAVEAADRALGSVLGTDSEIRDLESLIQTKKNGNSTIIRGLAIECVKLTMKGKTLRLPLASELFLAACSNAEERAKVAYFRAHPEEEKAGRSFVQVVPSWYTIKSDFARAMSHGLNPEKYKDGTSFRAAWQEWKKEHPDALKGDGRGSAQQAKSKEKANERAAQVEAQKITRDVTSFTANLKASLATLMGILAGLDEAQQNEAATMLADFNVELDRHFKAQGAQSGAKRAPLPAREAERPNAVAA